MLRRSADVIYRRACVSQRIREVTGQGAAGINNGPRGDLYLIAHFPTTKRGSGAATTSHRSAREHLRSRARGDVAVPTMDGEVSMTVRYGRNAEQQFMRLGGKACPNSRARRMATSTSAPISTLPTDLSDKEKETSSANFASLRNGKSRVKNHFL